MSRLALVLALSCFGAACTKPNPASCADGFCNDPALPFCDADGAIEGTPNTCIAVECTANDFIQCDGDTAILCNNTGDNYLAAPCGALGCDETNGCITETHSCTPGTVQCGDRVVETCNADGVFETEACDVSCIDAPAPHCSYLSPKYLPDVCDAPATEAHLDLGAFNTDVDSQCNGGIVTQVGGPDICVVRYGSIAVPTGIEAKITGKRALALVADQSVDIVGTLDIGAELSVNGPGAVMEDNTHLASTSGGGGGGGSGGGSGAAGGNASTPGGQNNGGPGYDPVALDLLEGGTGNAQGDVLVSTGGGGGAAALVACRGAVSVPGMIDANGGGGKAGGDRDPRTMVTIIVGGAGGGAGGLVVLEGLDVVVGGQLFANGGGGGAGVPNNGFIPSAGEDGHRDTTAAAGGAPTSTNGGRGGGGQASGAFASVGGASMGTGTGGGGGGATGEFVVVVPDGVTAPYTPVVASPQAHASVTATLR